MSRRELQWTPNSDAKTFYFQRTTDRFARLRSSLKLDNDSRMGSLRVEASEAVTSETEYHMIDQCAFLELPELLTEIFQSLETVDRQRCRRTCHLWEEILTSAVLSQDLRISLQLPSFFAHVPNDWSAEYVVYTCIFKHITAATRTICLRDRQTIYHAANSHVMQRWRNFPGFKNTMELERCMPAGKIMLGIQEALEDAGARLERLIVYQQSISVIPFDKASLAYFDSIAELYSSLKTCCNRVIWKDYSLRFNSPPMEFRIPYARFGLSNVDAAQIWDLFEERLVSSESLDMEILEHWTGELIARNVKDLEKSLVGAIFVLDTYQSPDPRASRHHFRQYWSLSDLDSLDVRKLNKFCLYAWAAFIGKLHFVS
ncbi:uncharacterized protein LOC129592984 [Paramacrobiotus metropolitanus]|uniref:uncharacterized protein LOC129592984 n=1 Tax=Paramacrobiotus metropolitanus TaxID=2943436 RepID=UPI002445C2DC|nr:uncharacterized protein LOC129592984 [Paramacrobiotus metropolitanus]